MIASASNLTDVAKRQADLAGEDCRRPSGAFVCSFAVSTASSGDLVISSRHRHAERPAQLVRNDVSPVGEQCRDLLTLGTASG